jgi:hypothetical protein
MNKSEAFATRKKAKEYLRFITSSEQPHLGSPWEVVQDALDRNPEEAWRIIVWAIALAKADDERSFIGTGPLEYFLVHHPEYLERSLELGERHENFREALRSADIRGGNPEDVARLDAFFQRIDSAAR